MNIENKEILFYYESRQNPNGDPGFDNQPRMMTDGTIMVTDVRLKRTVRDYARDVDGKTLFVDFDKNGNAIKADDRAKEIIGDLKGKDVILELIKNTYDTPLFGALVPVRSSKDTEERGDSHKLTGTVQFGIARSVNKVNILNPSIVGRFVGAEKKGQEKQHSTFGKFYAVEYALIKAYGAVTPRNLGHYLNNEVAYASFENAEKLLLRYLWEGTNSLVTRSKYPQRSVLLISVSYKSSLYNDLNLLVDESAEMKGNVNSLRSSAFVFDRFIESMAARKEKVNEIKLAFCSDISEDVYSLVQALQSHGLQVGVLPWSS